MESVAQTALKYALAVRAIKYGTAGFRTKAAVLEPVLYRMGLLAVLRSKVKQATIGVMVTASHNPEEDNGVKLVDPLGEMLEESWEEHATRLANAESQDVVSVLESLIVELRVDILAKSNVVYAHDTRPSGPSLVAALADGIAALHSDQEDFGVATTPQLHFIVRCLNDKSYGNATIDGYYEKLVPAFLHLTRNCQLTPLKLDCANGVGAVAFKQLLEFIGANVNVSIFNDGDGKLNHECGADFVKVDQKIPHGVVVDNNDRCASFDGDADRLIYFSQNNGNFYMLDGDRIAILITEYINELLDRVGLKLNIGLVQTAYANGSSTRYVEEKLKLPVYCAKTGVKFLHHAAKQFDVGVYFEANGHGTVLFSDSALKTIASLKATSPEHDNAIADLKAFVDLINQTVGDAISDLLVVEVILANKHINIAQWASFYHDLPNRQLKVNVPDRNIITTTDGERIVVTPTGLQNEINLLVAKYPQARAFVRPSGTEDIVRVYAESSTKENTELLAMEVAAAVKKFV